MALLAKKLYMHNSAGTTQVANIYSTVDEVGANYVCASADGINGYIPLVSTSDTRATSGRVTKSGTTYAISSIATPAYAIWGAFSGSGNFTVPAGVYRLRVTCVGGGAGGAVSGAESAHYGNDSLYVQSGAGGATVFGWVTANGGGASGIKKETICIDYDSEYSQCNSAKYPTTITLGTGYANAVIVINNTNTVGGTPVPIIGYNGAVLYNQHGTGGAVNSVGGHAFNVGIDTFESAVVGASGHRTVTTIAVTPGQVIAWSVGAGGHGSYETDTLRGTAYTWTAVLGGGVGPGTSGAIVVEYGRGIE